MSKFGAAAAATVTDISPAPASGWAIALLCVLNASFAASPPAQAAEAYSADAVKAEFLYRFAGYVEWPVELPPDAAFTIAVAGGEGVFAELQHLIPGRTVQNRHVEVRKVTAPSDLDQVQILYLPPHSAGKMRALLAAATARPILVVSDDDGGLASGSTVNFVQAERHVRFEISLTAAARSNLKINSGLLSVAARVEGNRPRADASCWQMSAFGLTPACLHRAVMAAIDTNLGAHRRVRLASAGNP